MTTVEVVRLFVALVSVAALVTAVARRARVDHTIALVVFGLVAGALIQEQGVALDPELVLFVLLPGLVFEAAYRLEFDTLRRTFAGVSILAVPGVVISAAVVAVVLNIVTGLALELGFVVGAMVSATDPVAVTATFRRLTAPRRLTTLVEAESLFNDGTSLVVFAIAVGAVETGIEPSGALLTFALTLVASLLIGIAVGGVGSLLLAALDDDEVEVAVSLAAAYGTYLLAESVHQSGVIATVVAGVVLGNAGRRFGMSEKTQAAIDAFWSFLAFLLTAFVFVLIGLATPVRQLLAALPWIAWTVAAILIGRAIVVYGVLGLASRLRHGLRGDRAIPLAWLHVMFWAGLRGAVASAMALSLPASFTDRSLLVAIVFGLVLFTILVQGSTAGWLIRRTGVGAPGRRPGADHGRAAEASTD